MPDSESKYKYNGYRIWLYCPGCKEWHCIDDRWDIKKENGLITINPSFRLRRPGIPDLTCHFFLRNSIIEYLNDCTHEFAGKKISTTEEIKNA